MKNKIITGVLIAVVLISAFIFGGRHENESSGENHLPAEEKIELAQKSEEKKAEIKQEPEKEETKEEKKEEQKTEAKEDAKKEDTLKCTLSVRCDTVLNNMDLLDVEKASIVPKDGVIFGKKEVEFFEGESVFDVLKRVMIENNIHLEFVYTPIYKSAYIEGIANLYEFDCGELSGWTYKVNGKFPGKGCSSIAVNKNDVIEWQYTCNLGKDVGGHIVRDE